MLTWYLFLLHTLTQILALSYWYKYPVPNETDLVWSLGSANTKVMLASQVPSFVITGN